ncbi:MAG: 1-deoxy-D-xylulose-5-phosphate reductoisomerase [Oscillospiraceae bacterium]|nr:1-deoxy-D-xylulose-5-phosphate reductoisomerase [Oscillospiraceae bacterium]
MITGSKDKKISILGSTGSIGTQTLAVCRDLGIRPVCLGARQNIALLEAQAREFGPDLVAVSDPQAAAQLSVALGDTDIKVAGGQSALIEAATLPQAETVVGAIVGVAGLAPILEAAKAGKTIALANKEPLVAAGELLTRATRESGGKIIPVDSEHSAIFQCLQAGKREDVTGLLLTASGGPFFGRSKKELENVTPKQAIAHPNWAMGPKISVDSATLMNKGLELIEAAWLFGLDASQIEIAIHRQSILHSGVYFADGSLIGQMGLPDMRTAIQYALTYPSRLPVAGVGKLSLNQLGALTFENPDRDTFECLRACERAASLGGLYPAAANAANEAAVALFFEGKLPFLRIGELVSEALERLSLPGEVTMENILHVDDIARAFVREHY